MKGTTATKGVRIEEEKLMKEWALWRNIEARLILRDDETLSSLKAERKDHAGMSIAEGILTYSLLVAWPRKTTGVVRLVQTHAAHGLDCTGNSLTCCSEGQTPRIALNDRFKRSVPACACVHPSVMRQRQRETCIVFVSSWMKAERYKSC